MANVETRKYFFELRQRVKKFRTEKEVEDSQDAGRDFYPVRLV